MKSPIIIIITAIVVLTTGAGVGYSLLNNPPSPASSPEVTPPPEPSITTKQSRPPSEPVPPPPSFEQKIAIVKEAMADVCATGESKEITMVFTEAEANEKAAEALASAVIPVDIPLVIESVHIDFQPGNSVLIEAISVIYERFKVTIKVITQVSIEAGKPKIDIAEVSFGFVPLPQLLKDKIVGLITQKIDDLLSQLTQGGIGCDGKLDLEFKDTSIQQEELAVTVVIERKG